MGKILIVDDSEDLTYTLSDLVRKEGYPALTAATGSEAKNILNSEIIDLVFLDIGLPDVNGLQLIPEFKAISPDMDIVVLTGLIDVQTAVTALKSGALDYMQKPFDNFEFKNSLHRIMQARISQKQVLLSRSTKGIDSIIGANQPILKLKEEIRMAAGAPVHVLVTGETGTGKELVARAIYMLQQEERRVFVKVDCSTLSSSIIESELFGYERGAFTDAKNGKKGLVELADGGILFLDEIGTLPVELQSKLLRLAEEYTFRRVGGLQDIRVDVRIIAATNLDLEQEIRNGRFREDLYYRLKVITLHMPPLRERGSDILLLAKNLLGQFSRELKKNIRGFSPEAEEALLRHNWPGNIRELRNSIERALIYSRGEWITPADLNIRPAPAAGNIPSEGKFATLEEIERLHIEKVLASVENNKSIAAKILGISRTTLREKLKSR